MTDRYFVSDLSTAGVGGTVMLTPEESNHAVRVMRIGEGATIEVFDGASKSAIGQVTAADRKAVLIEVQSVSEQSNMPDVEVEMLVALPKPERCKELVARLTELGVRRVIPVVCGRTQRPPSDGLMEKIRRGVVEACKQCRRNHLMIVEQPVAIDEALKMAGRDEFDLQLAHPTSQVCDVTDQSSAKVRVAIGPEGGFTEDEVALALAEGYRCMDLGQRIYRIETAAVVAATLAIYSGDQP